MEVLGSAESKINANNLHAAGVRTGGPTEIIPPESALLEAVNREIQALGRSERYLKAPAPGPELEGLQNKKILMVDDNNGVLGIFVQPLVCATLDHAGFLQHTSQTRADLAKEIIARNPEVVLLDYELSGGIRGSEIAQTLRAQAPHMICIGFSCHSEAKAAFARAGAHGHVKKNPGYVEENICELAALIRQIEAQQAKSPPTAAARAPARDSAASLSLSSEQIEGASRSARADEETLAKGGLIFSRRPDGQYVCHDLASVEKLFKERNVEAMLDEFIDQCSYSFRLKDKPVEKTAEDKKMDGREAPADFAGFLNAFSTMVQEIADMDKPLEKTADGLSIEERAELGRKIFKKTAAFLPLEGKSLFDKFLFLASEWWYYHPQLRTLLKSDSGKMRDVQTKYLTEKLLPCLPEPIQRSLSGFKVIGASVQDGHFGLYFSDGRGTRRIVTDTQLFELRDVHGYAYFDLSADGLPFARCCTDRGGERAFFDGIRLMSHDSFRTCAPKAVFFDGGYKVNSTECTIVNGMLYPLVDLDDKVAKTTGAWNLLGMRWMVDFTTQQALDSYAMSEASARNLVIHANGDLALNGTIIRPIGVFAPAQVDLQDSGFSLYGWSEFKKL